MIGKAHDFTDSIDSIQSNTNPTIHTGKVNSTSKEFTLGMLAKQAIANHPKYAHLFSGIHHVHITMKQ